MNTNPPTHCPQCAQPISQGVNVKGLCPNCLALIAFGPEESAAQTVTLGAGHMVEPAGDRPRTPRPLLPVAARYFGDYELLEEIARGGMGVVYRARQTNLNRIVAVKMILGGQLATDADVKRFRTEAEAAANLQHPNIVAIHETGEHEGRHYFSMDYVEGKNLAQALAGKPMPPAQAAALLKTITEAVHFAHQRGTLHRDLKPQNVLMDANGQPRITDFGLAKRVEKESELTQTGAVMGSPSYMPPEQAAGKNDLMGPASDVYSLGAILYQLLTGKAPFGAATSLEVIRQVMEADPIAPSKLNPKTPPDLETICLKCLEKKPERRYATARALAEELGRFLNHEPILAKPANAWRKAWTWLLRNYWALIGVAAMAGILLLGFAYGLWERVKYLEGRTTPQFYHPIAVMELSGLTFWLVLLPGLLFGRWLKGRRQRNLPVSNRQLALLAGFGFLLIVSGLWSDMMFIRFYVWKRPFFDSFPAIAAYCLGVPLLSFWAGGIMIWQAVRWQQANWSGSVAAEEEWLPLQAPHYSTLAFTAATFANLASFVLVAWLGLATGLFDGALNVVGPSPAGKNLLWTCFALITLGVSTAWWVYATRKIYRRPLLVSVFLGVCFVGAAVGWFSAPPYSSLPPTFVLTAMLAGLAGGWMQVKWVKIGKADPVAPLVLGELFHWDRRAFAITLAVVVVALGLIAGLFFRERVDVPFIFLFLGVTVMNALWPASFLAVRTTTGKVREFFLSILVAMVLFDVVTPLAILGVPMSEQSGIGLPMSEQWGNRSTLILHWLAIILIGNAAGCALIYFGKIRPKANPMSHGGLPRA